MTNATTPTVRNILMNEAFGPKIIALLPKHDKKEVLKGMIVPGDGTVLKYQRLLWSNAWTWDPGGKNPRTGLVQEATKNNNGWNNNNN